jgi:curved DNA-binding protein CbpA
LKTHYETLGVTAKADGVVIERAYKALIKRYHPDKRGPDAVADDEKAQAINEAYRILRDPQKRAQYDWMIGLGPSPETRLRHDETGDLYAEIADDIDDRPFWISLGFIVLAALVIEVVAHVESRAWLSTHRNGVQTAAISPSSGPATATLDASSAKAAKDSASPPASAAVASN